MPRFFKSLAELSLPLHPVLEGCWILDSRSSWGQMLAQIFGEDQMRCAKSLISTPPKTNGWNLKITCLKRKIIFQTLLLGSMLIFRGVSIDDVKEVQQSSYRSDLKLLFVLPCCPPMQAHVTHLLLLCCP